jgi:serine protease Do
MGLERAAGALVTDVPEGPAKEAGMQAGDVIISFAGNEVDDTRGLVRQVGNSPVGETVRVVVMRDGKTRTLRVTLGRREEAEGAVPAVALPSESEPESKNYFGLTVAPLTEDLRDELGLPEDIEGLAIIEVSEDSEAFEKGLRAGDVITEAGQEPVRSITDLDTRVEAAREGGRKSLLLLVRRGEDPRFVALPIN